MSVTIVILPILHRKREGYVEEFNFSDIVPTKAEIAANENKVRIILVGGDSSKPSIPGLENSVTNLNRWIWEDSKKEVKSLEFSSKMTEKWLWDNNIDESLEDGTKLDDLIVVTLSSTVMSRLDCMIYLETQRYKNRAYIHGDLKTRISIKTCLSELSAIKLAREIKKGKTVVVGDQEDKSMFNYPNKDITYELLSTRILPEDISSGNLETVKSSYMELIRYIQVYLSLKFDGEDQTARYKEGFVLGDGEARTNLSKLARFNSWVFQLEEPILVAFLKTYPIDVEEGINPIEIGITPQSLILESQQFRREFLSSISKVCYIFMTTQGLDVPLNKKKKSKESEIRITDVDWNKVPQVLQSLKV